VGLRPAAHVVFLGTPIFALGVYMLFLPPAMLVQQAKTTREFILWCGIAVYYPQFGRYHIPYGAWRRCV